MTPSRLPRIRRDATQDEDTPFLDLPEPPPDPLPSDVGQSLSRDLRQSLRQAVPAGAERHLGQCDGGTAGQYPGQLRRGRGRNGRVGVGNGGGEGERDEDQDGADERDDLIEWQGWRRGREGRPPRSLRAPCAAVRIETLFELWSNKLL